MASNAATNGRYPTLGKLPYVNRLFQNDGTATELSVLSEQYDSFVENPFRPVVSDKAL